MKRLLASFLSVALLFVTFNAAADCCSNDCSTSSSSSCDDGCGCVCSSIFIPRSVGDNLVRQATYKNYEYGQDCFYGTFGIDFRYQRSRKGNRIAQSLFGSNVLHFQGSSITGADRDENAILADNFGLSPAVDNYIGFCPRIQNYIVDFELYFGLDELCEGLFLQFNAPLAHSKFSLNGFDATSIGASIANNNGCCDNSCYDCGDCNDCNNNCCDNNGCSFPAPSSTTAFNPGCMDTVYSTGTTANPIAAATTFQSALSGTYLFGDMQTAWTSGRFNCGCNDDTKLASFNMILGYNFYECPDYNFGVFIRAAAPTGTDEDACCSANNVFSVAIGDNFWKLGGGLTGHAELYNCNDEHFVNVYLEGYINHLFSRCQVRSFDFKEKGCLSRYMLLKQFDSDNIYTGTLINAINFNTRKVETSISVQGEGQIEFVYSNDCGFSAGLGWNIYGHSGEDACSIGAPCNADLGGFNYGIKGCAPIQALGYQVTVDGVTDTCNTFLGALVTTNSGNPTTLNSTQSNATIHACGDTDNAQTLVLACVDGDPGTPGVVYINTCATDYRTIVPGTTLISAVTPAQDSSSTAPTITPTTGVITGLTADPEYVTVDDLNINSGLLRSQVTNKIFGHIDYAWTDCDWTPKVYLGGEVEFASSSKCQAMNAWAVYVGGTVSF